MYKTLLNEFDKHQKELMLENAELKKVLQQMKQEMMGILSPKKHSQKEEKCAEVSEVFHDKNIKILIFLLGIILHDKEFLSFLLWCLK